MKESIQFVAHPWGAIYNENSKILILGTMPSPKSRVLGSPYANPQNVFWKTIAEVLDKAEPEKTPEARRTFLLENRIALWDVLKSCDIKGASDAHIQNAVVNDFREVFQTADIQKVFTTGKAATKYFNQFCAETYGRVAEYLPSTSSANCAMHRKPEFLEEWKKIKGYL